METEEIRHVLNLAEERIFSVLDTLRYISDETKLGIDTRDERQTLLSMIDTLKVKYNNWATMKEE